MNALDYVLSGPLHIEMTRIIQAREELRDLRKKVADQAAEIERMKEACKAAYFYMPLATNTIEKSDCTICKDEWQSVVSQLRDVLSEGDAISETLRKTPEKESG